jgi:hypothetical protein
VGYNSRGNLAWGLNLPATGYSNGLTPAGGALTGLPNNLNGPQGFNFDWCDVIRHDQDDTAPFCYLMAFVPPGSKNIYAATSFDLLNWQVSGGTASKPNPITNDGGTLYDLYPSLHFDTPSYYRSGTGKINLYYVQTTDPHNLPVANVIHRIITLTGPQPAPNAPAS